MRSKTIFLSFVIALITILSVIAFTGVEKTAPINTYSTSTTTDINISGRINASGLTFINGSGRNPTRPLRGGDVINVTILNCTLGLSSTCTYGILASSLSLTLNASNGSIDYRWNFTASFTEGFHLIALNFTNATGVNGTGGGLLSNVTAIEIDVDYNIITIGQDVINLSTDTGNINISGILSADGGIVSGDGVTFGNTSVGKPTCEASITAKIIFEYNNLTFWGCDGTQWLNISVS